MKARLNKKMSLVDDIANFENLLWAWQKTKIAYRVGDIWFDTLELAYFEANTHSELTKIQNELLEGRYELNNLTPLPYPKGEKYNENTGKLETRVRQTFHIAVRDQVTWLAVVNIIGPILDFQMPFWSYGNRLYYSIWYEDSEKNESSHKKLKAGWYRSSSKSIFRSWKQSWPLFRHTISLTIKKMSKDFETDYSEQEKEMDENNQTLPKSFQVKYFDKQYWRKENQENATDMYWASIDFEKFYANLKIEFVVNNIIKYSQNANNDADFQKLLINLTTFNVCISNEWSDEYKKDINLNLDENDIFHGIPTGLFVAGFLANVALSEIDKTISVKLESTRNIAHFRYVDDHVILGYNFEQLTTWIKEYENIIKKANIGASVNLSKTEPKALADYLNPEQCSFACEADKEKVLLQKAKIECRLDPNFPVPLVTQTLAKVSNIADCDMDFLTAHEEKQLISDLEHLLITDFPEHELKSDTRVSFAASMLSSLIPKKRTNYSEVYSIRHKIFELTQEFKSIKHDDGTLKDFNKHLITKYLFNNHNMPNKKLPDTHPQKEEAIQAINNIKEYHKKLNDKVTEIENNILHQKTHIFKLLIKAAKENHDKTKLWRKLIDYCYNTNTSNYSTKKSKHNSLVDILEAISDVNKSGRSHKLSNDFLISQFILVLADRLINALYVTINSEDYLKINNAKCFISACFDKALLDKIFDKEKNSHMEYYIKSYKYLRMTIGTAAYISKQKHNTSKQNILDWNNSPHDWCQKQNVSLDKYLFYLMYKLNNKNSPYCFNLWEKMSKFSKNTVPFLEPFNQETLQSCKEVDKEYISLFEWICFCKELANDSECVFDPRLSEWMALKIVEHIVNIYIERDSGVNATVRFFSNEKNETIIHPKYFMLPAKWKSEKDTKSWDYYKSLDFTSIKYDGNGAVLDTKYTPAGIKLAYDIDKGDFLSLYGFSVILCQLISHEPKFPWIWNIPDKNIEYSNYIFSFMRETTVSSYTKSIIKACTLSRSRETFRLSEIFNDSSILGISKDTSNDPPMIVKLSDLKKYIHKAVNELEKSQISIGENKPRQMIPLRLRSITESQPF